MIGGGQGYKIEVTGLGRGPSYEVELLLLGAWGYGCAWNLTCRARGLGRGSSYPEEGVSELSVWAGGPTEDCKLRTWDGGVPDARRNRKLE